MSTLPKIFFDANAGTKEWGYPLKFRNSLIDLERIPDGPREGMKVIIYTPGELEMEAVLTLEQELGYWKALPIAGTLRYLDRPK